jgi:hypothetical protein
MKFSTTIIDRRDDMSELDRQQTKKIVWLQLASVAKLIERVRIAIKRIDRPGKPIDFSLQIVAILKSGRRVHVQVSRDDFREAILAATDEIKVQVFARAKVEKTWLPRAGSSLVGILGTLAQRFARRGQHAAM